MHLHGSLQLSVDFQKDHIFGDNGHTPIKLAILWLKITQVSENGVLLPRKNVEVCEQVRLQ